MEVDATFRWPLGIVIAVYLHSLSELGNGGYLALAENQTVLRVFVGSPSDVQEDCKLVEAAADEINRTKAHGLNAHLEVVSWQEVLPGPGRPQDLINKEVSKADLVILLLWKRWGTPGKEFSSRFLEEYEISADLGKHVILYFREIPPDLLSDPGDQLKAVLRFRRQVEAEDSLLYAVYGSPDQLEKTARRHLADWLDRWASGTLSSSARAKHLPGFEGGAHVTRLAPDQLLAAPIDLWADIADTLVIEADFRLGCGSTERAGELIARASSLFPSANTLGAYQRFLARKGRFDDARIVRHALEKIAEASGDLQARFFVLEGRGNEDLHRGRLASAERAFRATRRLGRSHKQLEVAANAEMHLGTIRRMRGDIEGAIKHYNAAIKLADQGNEMRMKVSALVHKSHTLLILNKPKLALEAAKTAEVLSAAENLHAERMKAHVTFELILQHTGRLDEALSLVRQDIELARKMGDQELTCFLLSYEGQFLVAKGDREGAVQSWEEADSIARYAVGVELSAQIAYNLGSLALDLGRRAQGDEALSRARDLFSQMGIKDIDAFWQKRSKGRLGLLTNSRHKAT
jgi:tetratricopeptide (TPR) repeat protein